MTTEQDLISIFTGQEELLPEDELFDKDFCDKAKKSDHIYYINNPNVKFFKGDPDKKDRPMSEFHARSRDPKGELFIKLGVRFPTHSWTPALSFHKIITSGGKEGWLPPSQSTPWEISQYENWVKSMCRDGSYLNIGELRKKKRKAKRSKRSKSSKRRKKPKKRNTKKKSSKKRRTKHR